MVLRGQYVTITMKTGEISAKKIEQRLGLGQKQSITDFQKISSTKLISNPLSVVFYGLFANGQFLSDSETGEAIGD